MFSIIVAYDKNKLIGNDNKIPWNYKEDLKYFKDTTINKTVVMGRKTYESIGKPLEKRKNIVISKTLKEITGIKIFDSVDSVISKYKDVKEEIFIIGGANIYKQFINVVDKLYITEINKEFKGDTYFIEFNKDDFILTKEKNLNELSFKVYVRK